MARRYPGPRKIRDRADLGVYARWAGDPVSWAGLPLPSRSRRIVEGSVLCVSGPAGDMDEGHRTRWNLPEPYRVVFVTRVRRPASTAPSSRCGSATKASTPHRYTYTPTSPRRRRPWPAPPRQAPPPAATSQKTTPCSPSSRACDYADLTSPATAPTSPDHATGTIASSVAKWLAARQDAPTSRARWTSSGCRSPPATCPIALPASAPSTTSRCHATWLSWTRGECPASAPRARCRTTTPTLSRSNRNVAARLARERPERHT